MEDNHLSSVKANTIIQDNKFLIYSALSTDCLAGCNLNTKYLT